jgi:sugar O-acyltransferase (sialic acid O-acetyltransferase NeuD family)
MKKKLILIGGGGHCISCIDVIEQEGIYDIAGIVDVKEKIGDNILGYPIIAEDNDIDDLSKNYNNFLITVGQIGSAELRLKLFDKIKDLGKYMPIIKSPNAYISQHTKIGEGTIIMHGAVVNSASVIGKNCIVNSKALIEHNVIIKNHSHISTAAIVNGSVIIGNGCTIGSNSTIIQNIEICDNVFVGAASFLNKNINEAGIYLGSPAKKKQ